MCETTHPLIRCTSSKREVENVCEDFACRDVPHSNALQDAFINECGMITQVPKTEEIALQIITTAKIPTSFHLNPRNFQTSFHGSPKIFQQKFIEVNGSPRHSEEWQENRRIWRSKYFKSDFLRKWLHTCYTRLLWVSRQRTRSQNDWRVYSCHMTHAYVTNLIHI